MEKEEVLFYTNYYKRTQFFDDTLLRIARAGYRIVVLLTGPAGEFRNPSVNHPNTQVVHGPSTSYDHGMTIFKRNRLLDLPGINYICHIDCDCFLGGTQEMEVLFKEFEEEKYDYVCHLCGSTASNRYKTNTQIGHVHDQYFKDNGPNEPPTPEPHYENAFQVIRKSTWDKLSLVDVGHHRRFLAGLAREGAKFGSRNATYMWDYTNWGKEWWHIGHIFERFNRIEAGQDISSYNPDSEFDLFRAGFFAAQERIYGSSIYSANFHANLAKFYDHFGGKDRTLECWDRIVKGTCMETWEKLS